MNNVLIWIIYLIIGYLVGSLSFSYIVARLRWKEDIRELGSRNAGASNMTINHGWGYGVLVFILDFLKIFLLVKFFDKFPYLSNLPGEQVLLLKLCVGLMVVIGHVYPFWLKFRGGKGTASAIGLGFGLSTNLGLIGLATVILVTVISGYVALGGILLWLSIAIASWFIFKNAIVTILLLIFTLFSAYLHRANLGRILKGEETSLKMKFDDEDKKKK